MHPMGTQVTPESLLTVQIPAHETRRVEGNPRFRAGYSSADSGVGSTPLGAVPRFVANGALSLTPVRRPRGTRPGFGEALLAPAFDGDARSTNGFRRRAESDAVPGNRAGPLAVIDHSTVTTTSYRTHPSRRAWAAI